MGEIYGYRGEGSIARTLHPWARESAALGCSLPPSTSSFSSSAQATRKENSKEERRTGRESGRQAASLLAARAAIDRNSPAEQRRPAGQLCVGGWGLPPLATLCSVRLLRRSFFSLPTFFLSFSLWGGWYYEKFLPKLSLSLPALPGCSFKGLWLQSHR